MWGPSKSFSGNYQWQPFFSKLKPHDYFEISFSDTAACKEAFRRWRRNHKAEFHLHYALLKNYNARVYLIPSTRTTCALPRLV